MKYIYGTLLLNQFNILNDKIRESKDYLKVVIAN